MTPVGGRRTPLGPARTVMLLAALAAACAGPAPRPDPAGASFTVDGRAYQLAGGRYEAPAAPGSATMVRLQLTDKRAVGDLDGDGKNDTLAVLSFDPGGSGAFWYAATLLSSRPGQPGETVLLGDRITVEVVRVAGGRAHLEFMDRRPGEPMTATPTVHTVRDFLVTGGKLAPAQP